MRTYYETRTIKNGNKIKKIRHNVFLNGNKGYIITTNSTKKHKRILHKNEIPKYNKRWKEIMGAFPGFMKKMKTFFNKLL